MRSIINRLKILERNLSVLLRGGEAGVAQQLLNRSKICAVAQQMGCVSMPKAVRVNSRIACCQNRIQFYEPSHLPVSQTSAAGIQE